MAKKPDIVSEVFVDANGKVVSSAKEAAQIEVTTREPDGTLLSTLLIVPHPDRK